MREALLILRAVLYCSNISQPPYPSDLHVLAACNLERCTHSSARVAATLKAPNFLSMILHCMLTISPL